MKRVLIVEDSKTMSAMLGRRVRSDLKLQHDIAGSFKEAKEFLKKHWEDYVVAVVDLHLPDAPKGEVVDYVLHQKIPVIVFTSQFSDEMRETMLSKNVVDYVVKEGGPQVIDYLIRSIERFYKNRFVKVMVVDDSSTSRSAMKFLLEAQKFVVVEASSGKEALKMLEENPEVRLLITDYNMPKMDGFQLVSRIREKLPKDKLAIIGISAYGTSLMSARFLKAGASDFLTKPFLEEELFCRINQNLEMLEYIDTIKNISNIDFLTGIFNRRYLFRFGQKLYENAKRGNIDLTAALVHIDRLGEINDKYGFEVGDNVVKEIAQMLTRNFRAADIVVRFGGEDFAILATNMDKSYTTQVFERIRTRIAERKITCCDHTLSITASIGVTTRFGDSLEGMVKRADSLRYQAKQDGRDCVVVD